MYNSGIWVENKKNSILFEQMTNEQREKWLNDNKMEKDALLLIINRLCSVVRDYQNDYQIDLKYLEEEFDDE